MDWSKVLVPIIIAMFGSFIVGRRKSRPDVGLLGISKEDQEQLAAFVAAQQQRFNQIPWGQSAPLDRMQAEQIYHQALDIILIAEGEYGKLSPIVDMLRPLPIDLAYSGLARMLLTYAYFRDDIYSPRGVQAALDYTAAAVKNNPRSIDAWEMRLNVASVTSSARYRTIARDALEHAQKLDPNHPYLPYAALAYYKRYGSREQFEAAVRRMIELAPTPARKRAGYDRLATLYLKENRLDDAIATYRQMLFSFPEGTAWTWHNYSLALYRAKRYQEALDASNHALSFFEFGMARKINNLARKALGMPPAKVNY